MFNMILHYNFMLNDFSTTVTREQRLQLLQILKDAASVCEYNAVFKESLILI